MSSPLENRIRRVIDGSLQRLLIRASEPAADPAIGTSAADGPHLILPGSFNPLHQAHCEMARIAEQLTGLTSAFELSVVNVDKGMLDTAEITNRIGQFENHHSLWLTSASKFDEKSHLFRAATFVVGADTILRMADLRYYDHDAKSQERAFEGLAEDGSRFLVFGRHIQSVFRKLSQLELPAKLSELCTEVPEDIFRVDLSSSEIRSRGSDS